MGLLQNIKDFYYGLEDGYYKVLDKINGSIPVYKVIDPIDEVVPSFLLFILLLVFALAGAFLFFQGGVTPPSLGPKALLSMTVTDAKGNSLQDAQVSLTADAEEYTLTTNDKGQLAIELVKGAQVQVLVTKDGYEGVTKSFTFGDDTLELKLSLQEKEAAGPAPPQARTISIVDKAGKQLEGVSCKVRLGCSTLGARFLQDTYNVTGGSLSYLPPDSCGTVIVNVDCPGSDAFNGIDDGSGLIHLQQAEVKEGGVLIRLNPTLDGAHIQMRDAAGAMVDEGYSSYGEKTFKAAPGTYYVVVTDVTGDYATAQSEKFIIYPDQTKTVDVALTKEVKAVVQVRVLDKATGNVVAHAKVTLKRENGEALGTQEAEAGKSYSTFNLEEKGKFFIEAYHDDYLSSADVAVDATNASKAQPLKVDVRLEKLTAENSGQVMVKVVDEEGLPVPNAKVSMYYSQTKFLCEACGSASTDVNGTTSFRGLAAGKYYAFAQKFPATGKSPDQDLQVKQVTKFTVNMTIGFGTVKVNAKDADNLPVPFATVEIFSPDGTKLGTISADDQGVANYQAKADKAVYVRVSKEGLTSWTSRTEQVYPAQTIEFNALLVERIIGTEPKVLFDGIFDKANALARAMAPGERYKARFSIRVPNDASIKNLSFFLRTGTENSVEKDPWFVNNVNVPTTTILRGTTWNPPLGNDEQLLTNGDAKWAKITWARDAGIEPGIYNVDVELKVRPETPTGRQLALGYRVQSEKMQGGFLRDPVDTALGTSLDTAAKKGLYANSYEKAFSTGQQETCSGSFCYGERVYDTVDNVYLTVPYQLRVFQKYRFESSTTNNSPAVHDNANLRVKVTEDGLITDDKMVVNNYRITNADATQFTDNVPKYELPAVNLGNFTQNKTITTEMELEARKEGETNLQQKIISTGTEAFNHQTPFGVFSEQRLNINVDQEDIPAYLQTEMGVSVTYASGENSGFPVEGALIRLRRRTPDLVETIQLKTTDQYGKAKFLIPASAPGTKLTLEVEKRGYATESKVITISDKPVEISPASLDYSLGLTTNSEQDLELKFNSKIPQKLYIKSMSFNSEKFRGLLDLQKMQNYLNQYTLQPFWLERNAERSINVKAAVSALAKLLKEQTTVEGNLKIVLTNEAGTATFIYSVPIKAGIGLAEMPKVKNCLVIQPTAWKDTTFEAKLVKGITVKNNCIDKNGQPMPLSNLTGMMVWNGDVVGYVEITLNDTASSASPTVMLQSNRPTLQFETVPADKEYAGSLTFTPLPETDVLGKTAKFQVVLDAEVLTDSGPQSIGASKLDGEILITNLAQCVKFTPDPQAGVRIKRDDADGEEKVSLDTSACGNIDIDFRFCDHDDCRGGTADGGIGVDPEEITNAKPDQTNEIMVKRKEIPGYYGMTVQARPTGGSWRQIADYKVVVESTGFLDLDKYRFYTLPGETDSAALLNYIFREKVDVTADMCAWGQASKNPDFTGAGAIILVGGVLATILIGGTIGGPLILVGVLMLAFGMLGIFDEDCHDKKEMHTLTDYAINLTGTADKNYARYVPPDALPPILIDRDELVRANLSAMFNLDVADIIGAANDNPVQTVGVNFQNLGLQEDKPTYAITTISTKIHHHGDPTHTTQGAVECDNGNFGNYWIGPAAEQGLCDGAVDDVYHQRFHLRFQTSMEQLSIPPADFDRFACSAGVQLGVNGPGALPKTRLSWNWSGQNAIGENSCSADNPDGIYCDAVQANIMLVKRLAVLEEFLKANNYDFTCPPEDPVTTATTQFNLDNATHTVTTDSFGLSAITGTQSGDDITIRVTATNKTAAAADASVEVRVAGTSGQEKTCTIPLAGVGNAANANTKNGECLISDLGDGMYTAAAQITSSTASSIDSASVAFGFQVNLHPQPNPLEQATGCRFPRTTETLFGESMINKFIAADSSVNWTARIPNLQALNKLTKFNATLMEDAYTPDLFADFYDYYTNVAFADAGSAFHSLATDANGTAYGFNKFYKQNKVLFTRKYEAGVNRVHAGVYEFEIAPYFTTDWKFFDDQGQPKGTIGVTLHRIADPVPDSKFYRMPFDGLVGLRGGLFDRQGYGVSFANLNPTETIKIDNNPVALLSYADAGSNPVNKVFTSIEKDIKPLNTSPQSKGTVLRVESSGDDASKMIMAPSYATPVVLVMSKAGKTPEPFSAFYTTSDSQLPVNTGPSFTEWSGAGACLNFDGQLVTEAFRFKPDRAATQQDQLFNFQNAYGVDWDKADYAGKVFLRTIVYTPRHMNAALKAEAPAGELTFMTADDFDALVNLKGISTMAHNRPGSSAADVIGSLQDVFDLVSSGELCMREEGTTVSVFWNPEKLYKTAGARQSVHDFVQGLEAGNTCIGYPARAPIVAPPATPPTGGGTGTGAPSGPQGTGS